MRESRLYGSERGARREARSYRDPADAGRFVLLKILKYDIVRDVAARGGEGAAALGQSP